MEEIKNKVVFISPLDWGLGHASRCVPIITELSKNNRVIIGITVLNETYFNFYFPDHQKIKVPSYEISYSKTWPAYLKVLFQAPKIIRVIRKEKQLIRSIINQHQIDLIISDNRFGFFHPQVTSIFITHQLNVKVPFLSGLANFINRKLIHQFNEVWVPDYEHVSSRLSGELCDSHKIKIPVKYIGPQSALSGVSGAAYLIPKIDLLILLSGAEPKRSSLEKQLSRLFIDETIKCVIVRGTTLHQTNENNKVTFYNEVFGEELKQLILCADKIICRSGYSTLMDLHLLNKKKLLLIPTPGQTEQEYLAIYWKEKFGAQVCTRGKLRMEGII